MPNSYKQHQEVVFLSDEAWSFFVSETERLCYTGKAAWHGTGAYIRALLGANPLATDWTDERPAHVRQFDKYRLANYMGPLWFELNAIGASASDNSNPGTRNAGRRSLPKHHYDAALSKLLELSAAHQIDHPNRRYRHTPTPRSMATATLEAIGLGYLAPRNPVPQCTNPAKTKLIRSGRKGQYTYTDARTTRNTQRKQARTNPEHTYNW